jgi:hypothetical protein
MNDARPRGSAFGTCASCGGFYDTTTLAGIDKIIPCDIYIPGPPRPEAVFDGLMPCRTRSRAGSHARHRQTSSRPGPSLVEPVPSESRMSQKVVHILEESSAPCRDQKRARDDRVVEARRGSKSRFLRDDPRCDMQMMVDLAPSIFWTASPASKW